MTSAPMVIGGALADRVRQLAQGGIERLDASPFARLEILRERWVEVRGGHPAAPEDGPHLEEALAWLERAQDAGQGGLARGYSLARVPGLGPFGWQAAYPETTGYIIPTLYAAAWIEQMPWLAARATHAARWELEVQLPTGAVQAGVIGQGRAPAVFNTGQVIFGWLAAWQETGAPEFAEGVRRAARWLCDQLDDDGVWRRGNSPFAGRATTHYNARTAWALVAAGHRLGAPEFKEAGARALHAVARAQHENGWFPECCLDDAAHPLTHTLAYTVQGLLEGGLLLGDAHLIEAAIRPARRLATALAPDGHLPGRFGAEWRPAARWSCLTGTAQMAVVWGRLDSLEPALAWSDPAAAAIAFLKRTQNRSSLDPGLRGGIKGSAPMTGEYGRLQVLSWATKFFADALLRRRLATPVVEHARAAACLALA